MLRHRVIAVAGIAAVLSGSGIAYAQTQAAPASPDATAPAATSAPTTPCTPLTRLYAHRNWRDATPLAGENPCPMAASRAKKLKLEFHTYRAYRKIAHVPGFHEGDPYLEWLPRIPRYVVACETRGKYGRSRWTAANPSGAVGPAQLLLGTWNPPWPIRTNQDKLHYWQIVAGLWGHTSWSCA